MGKGDKKTKRGKIISGSYGVRRPKKLDKKPILEIKPEKIIDIPVKKTVTEEKIPVAKKATVKKVSTKKTKKASDTTE